MSTSTMIKERPILFSAPMVRAILAGTKTQTRRMMKPQPLYELSDYGHGYWGDPDEAGEEYIRCPYGAPEERLWVRETVALECWTYEYALAGDKPPIPTDRPWKQVDHPDGEYWLFPHYRATDPEPELGCERDRCRVCESGEAGPHWTPSIHMPRWASRITLEITDVRVQRVQDFSEEDAIAEGVERNVHGDGSWSPDDGWLDYVNIKHGGGEGFPVKTARESFGSLWVSINGVGSWTANPWVWAITFKRVTP